MHMSNTILDFWFGELTQKDWFSKNIELDTDIRGRFGEIHRLATQSALWDWRKSPRGRLAEILILDQLSRNILKFLSEDDSRVEKLNKLLKFSKDVNSIELKDLRIQLENAAARATKWARRVDEKLDASMKDAAPGQKHIK